MIDIKEITTRVNLACNFYADTKGVDYVEDLTIKEVLEYDKENQENLYLFKKELSRCGY